MSAYEQKIEPPDRHWQYLLFAAEPYETIGFKVPSREVDKSESKFWTLWNKESKQFFLQFAFKVESKGSTLIHQQNLMPLKNSSNGDMQIKSDGNTTQAVITSQDWWWCWLQCAFCHLVNSSSLHQLLIVCHNVGTFSSKQHIRFPRFSRKCLSDKASRQSSINSNWSFHRLHSFGE